MAWAKYLGRLWTLIRGRKTPEKAWLENNEDVVRLMAQGRLR
jgi:hypothetical protein